MVDVRADAKGDGLSGRNVEDRCALGPRRKFVAGHGCRVDVGHGPVGLVIGCLADLFPVAALNTIGSDARDRIYRPRSELDEKSMHGIERNLTYNGLGLECPAEAGFEKPSYCRLVVVVFRFLAAIKGALTISCSDDN